MNYLALKAQPSRNTASRCLGLACVLLCIPFPLAAQTSPPSPATADQPEDPIQLNPFVIEASTETGWVATDTLSGSRMKTQVKDLAQPLEIMTMDFMQDLGLNNFEQALIYSTNIEGRNEVTSGDGLGFGVFQPRNNTRVRGLQGATLSRNFFEAAMPTDNYNLDRITIARGPNSILFGLGSPSGIVDVSLQRANLNKRAVKTEFQADSEDSRRSSLNVNQPIIPGKLGLRVAALSEEAVTDAKPNLDRQDRYYGALTAQPFRGTTISIHGEKVNRMSNRSPRILPVDAYSLWLNAPSVPGSRYTSAMPLFDNRITGATNPANTGSTANVTVANVNTLSPIFTRQNLPPVMLFGAGSLDGNFQSWNNAVSVRQPQNQLAAFNPLNSFDRFSFNPENSIVPYDTNTFGTSRAQKLNSDLFNVFWEQRLADSLFFEFAYNKEDLDEKTADSGFGSNTIEIDVNQYLPGTSTPNPNVGRYYTQGRAIGSEFWENREDWRATLSYEFDFARKFDHRLLKLLGRHRLAGLISRSESTRRGHQLQRGILEQNASITGVTLPTGSVGATTGTGTANWATNGNRDFNSRYYLGGTGGNSAYHPFGDLFGTWALTDSAGNPMGAYLFTSPYTNAQGWELVRTGSGPEGSLVQADTLMFALQSYFIRDRLVLLYGYREDEGKSATIDPIYQVRDFSGLYPSAAAARFGAYAPPQTGITRTFGAVAHLTSWASLTFNQSDTFQLNIGRFDPFGNEYPGAVGDAKDIGIALGLFDRKLVVRASYFSNTAGPTRAGNQGFNDPIRDQLWNIEDNMRLLDPQMATINLGSGGFRDKGRANYWVMFDAESEGYELDLTFTPNRNWSFKLNAAKNEAVESNIGLEWISWLNQRLPLWQALNVPEGGKTNPRDVNGDGVVGTWTWATAPWDRNNQTTSKTFQSYYNEDVVAQSLAFIEAVDGRGRDQGRKYRANFIADYNFSEGRFKGFGANIALRYRSAPNLGYGAQVLPSGLLAFDLESPIEGTEEFITDLGLRYRGKLRFFDGMNYRVQLNVRNLLDDTDLVPVKTLTNGQYVSFSRVEPRVYQLTVGFEF